LRGLAGSRDVTLRLSAEQFVTADVPVPTAARPP
jgi:hypothetical protein